MYDVWPVMESSLLFPETLMESYSWTQLPSSVHSTVRVHIQKTCTYVVILLKMQICAYCGNV